MNYKKESDNCYILIVEVDYPVYLQPLNRDLLILSEKRIVDKVTKLMCTFYDKKKNRYVKLDY